MLAFQFVQLYCVISGIGHHYNGYVGDWGKVCLGYGGATFPLKCRLKYGPSIIFSDCDILWTTIIFKNF